MSTTCIHIVPKYINEYPNSKLKAKEILDWFKNREIIEEDLSDCILSTDKKGYRFKPNVASLFNDGERWAYSKTLKVHGLELVYNKRTVFYSMDGPGITIKCPNCETTIDENLGIEWVSDWYENIGTDNKICPLCKKNNNLLQYDFGTEVVLSNIGISLWNTHWDLEHDFLEEMRKLFKTEIITISARI